MERGCDNCIDGIVYYKKNGYIASKLCDCELERLAKQRAKKSGLGNALQTKRFENIKSPTDEIAQAIETCLNFIDKGKGNNLLITGGTGTGKTYLAIATASELILEKNVDLRYVGYRDLVTTVKPLAMEYPERENLMNKYKTVEVLLIDDLYKSNVTEADLALIYEIINYRYLNELSTIITSEKDIKQLIGIDSAIAGRLAENSIDYYINLKGKDNRLK